MKMYLDLLNPLLLLLPIFHQNTTNSSLPLDSENLVSVWDLDLEEPKSEGIGLSLSFLPDIPDFQFPVCCNFNSTTDQEFHCNKFKNSNPDLLALAVAYDGNNNTTKRLKWNMPKCANGEKYIIFDPEEIQSRRFLRNGYFGHNNEFYNPQEYCINRLTGEPNKFQVEVRICEPECSEESPCIQKCCYPDEIYSFSQRKCIKSNSVLYSPMFYKDMSNRLLEQKEPHFSIRFPRSFKYNCQENTTQIFPSGNLFAEYLSNTTGRKYFPADFRVRTDGSVLYRKDGKAIVLPDGHPIFLKEQRRKCYTMKTEFYCLDGATEYGDPDPFSNDEGQVFLVTCSENLYQPPIIGPLSFVYGNVMMASSFFSLLTALVYILLKEKRNIHGLTVISYAFSMFLMYVFLGLAHLIRYYGSDEVLKTKACVFIGIASHLFSLSSFLWLTMMNYDLWQTFRKIRPTSQNAKLWKDYLKYSIVGFGIPLIIISASSYLHFNYEQTAEDDCAEFFLPLPAYGRESCEIKQLSLGVYLYFPATVLLLGNFAAFIVTTYSLCKHEKTTLIAVKGLERHHQSIQLFGKLFFVMGVTRVFEVITWGGSGLTLTWYWAVFDIFNILQAVAIFVIYVCKQDILQALKEKVPNIMRIVEACSPTKAKKGSCKL